MKNRMKFNQEMVYILLAIAVLSLVVGYFQYEPTPYFVLAIIIFVALSVNLIIYNKPIQSINDIKILLVLELLNCQEEIDKLDFINDIEDEVVLDEIKKKHQELSQKMKIIENKIKLLDKTNNVYGQNT